MRQADFTNGGSGGTSPAELGVILGGMAADLLQAWLEGERIRELAARLGIGEEELEARLILELRELDRRITGPAAVPDVPPAA